jgi:hypothetical protein
MKKFLKCLPALFMFYGSSRHAILVTTMKDEKLVRKMYVLLMDTNLLMFLFFFLLFHKSTIKTNINGWKKKHIKAMTA